MSFKQQLIELLSCQKAIDWVKNRTIQQAWNDCPYAEWMLRLLEEMEGKEGWPDEKEIMLLGCWCARRVLKYVPEGEDRPLKAIEAKEGWAKGEITREEMVAVRNAAWPVTRIAIKATMWAAARAAASAVASAAASDAAWAAAKDAAWAATDNAARAVAWSATFDVAFDKESSIQADYIRKNVTLPKGKLCLLNNN